MRRNRPIKLENTIPMSSCIGTPPGPADGRRSFCKPSLSEKGRAVQRYRGREREDFSWIYEKQTCQYSVGPEIHRDAADQAVFKEKENGRLEAPLLGAVPDARKLLAVEGGILERGVGVLHLRAGGAHSDAPGGVKGRVSGLQIPD